MSTANIQNAALVDAERSIFTILGLVRVQLFGGVWWQTKDITAPSALGSAFHAYDESAKEFVASINIVDASGDDEEPNISDINESDVIGIDAYLENGVSSQLNVVKWMKSQLNVKEDLKVLVTAYIVEDDGKRWQYIALRTSKAGRKWVIVGMFDIAQKDRLAREVFVAISNVTFLE